MQTHVNTGSDRSEMLNGVSETSGISTNGNNSIVRFVSRLLRPCRPSTVARLVVAVRIWPAIKRQTRRTFSHICQKVLEPSPSFANRYSPSAIILPLPKRRAIAAPYHIFPTKISGRLLSASGESVLRIPCLWPAIDARATDAISQIAVGDFKCLPTSNAKTKAVGGLCSTLRDSTRSISKDFPLAKTFSNERYSSRHNGGSFTVLFSGGRSATTGAHCESRI